MLHHTNLQRLELLFYLKSRIKFAVVYGISRKSWGKRLRDQSKPISLKGTQKNQTTKGKDDKKK